MELDASQLAAVEAAYTSRVSVITGGAGTGKTSIIATIAKRAESPLLMAFAGKAAARLREATGRDASTIHRALMYDGSGFRREHLHGHAVIIDEASMIDSALLAEVVRRQPRQLILVGDDAQLPPVGRGQPFHDLIRLRPGLVQRLTTCYRQTEAVYHAANDIREGTVPVPYRETATERWEMRGTGTPELTHAAILDMVRAGDIDFAQDIVLIPRNGEGTPEEAAPCTVTSLNAAIRDVVNPDHTDARVDVGDRVINTKNIADLDVWNGTTGRVQFVDDSGGVMVQTDVPVADPSTGEPTDMVLFARDVAKHLRLAYALTVHKAQGSQYRRVVFAALQRDTWALLDRALLYTAVTRAKAQCLVVGQPSAVKAAIDAVPMKRTVMQMLGGRGEAA